MTYRRHFLHSISALLITSQLPVWSAPGDWQTALGSPLDLHPIDVQIRSAAFKGRSAVAVEFTAEAQKRSLTVGGNAPTFALLKNGFSNGVIEVDIAASLNGKGAPDARGFAGIAFHIDERVENFDAVYLRMTNGTKNNPPPPTPRNIRAVQYVAHPDFHFDVSRSKFPEQYEKAAPVAIDTWHRLRIEVDAAQMRVSVDGVQILQVQDLRHANRKGGIGLFVDDGTIAYFANLKVTPRA